MTQVSPGAVVRQLPRTVVVYGLAEAEWGTLTEPCVVTSVRPANIGATLHVEARTERTTTRSRLCLEVSGGIAGARYEVRLSPTKAFQVRVTSVVL